MSLKIFFTDHKILTNKKGSFFKMYKSLYEEFKVESRINRSFPFLFTMRRALLVVTVMFMSDSLGIQVLIIIYSNLFYFVITGNI